MSADELIAIASREPLRGADVARAAAQIGVPAAEMLDIVARRIAEGYSAGEYDFSLCDTVMNEVFSYAIGTTDLGLSRFAWGVFEAFDQGEFRGEDVARNLIAAVLSRGYLMVGDR